MTRDTLCLAVTHVLAARANMMGRRWNIGVGTRRRNIESSNHSTYNTDMRGLAG